MKEAEKGNEKDADEDEIERIVDGWFNLVQCNSIDLLLHRMNRLNISSIII